MYVFSTVAPFSVGKCAAVSKRLQRLLHWAQRVPIGPVILHPRIGGGQPRKTEPLRLLDFRTCMPVSRRAPRERNIPHKPAAATLCLFVHLLQRKRRTIPELACTWMVETVLCDLSPCSGRALPSAAGFRCSVCATSCSCRSPHSRTTAAHRALHASNQDVRNSRGNSIRLLKPRS